MAWGIPPPRGQTYTCENITFPHRMQTVINDYVRGTRFVSPQGGGVGYILSKSCPWEGERVGTSCPGPVCGGVGGGVMVTLLVGGGVTLLGGGGLLTVQVLSGEEWGYGHPVGG